MGFNLRKIEESKELRRAPISYSTSNYFVQTPARKQLNLQELVNLFLDDNVTRRAIKKKARDLASSPTTKVESEELQHVADEFNDFLQRRSLQLKLRMVQMLQEGMVCGNGFAEIVYVDDTSSPDEPSNGTDIESLAPLNPLNVIIVEDDRRYVDTNLNPQYGKIAGFYVFPGIYMTPFRSLPLTMMNVVFTGGEFLHHSRVLHYPVDTFGDGNVGIGLVDSAKHIIKSKIKADSVIGTILVRYAKPIIKAILENGDPSEIKELSKLIHKVNANADEVAQLVTDDAVKELGFMSGNTSAIAPKEFYNILFDNIAVAVGIPRVLITGYDNSGGGSGSDFNLVSYFQDLQAEQEDGIEPLYIKLLREYWRVTGRKTDVFDQLPFWIEYNVSYADEMAMFKATLMNTQASANAYKTGLITKNEAREKMGFNKISGGDEFIPAPKLAPQERPTLPDDDARGRSSNIPKEE